MKEQTLIHNGRSVKVYDVELVMGMIKQWIDSGYTKDQALDILFYDPDEPAEVDEGYINALLNDNYSGGEIV